MVKLRLHPAHAYYLCREAIDAGLDGLLVDDIPVTRENDSRLALYCSEAILAFQAKNDPEAAIWDTFRFGGPEDHLMWVKVKAIEAVD